MATEPSAALDAPVEEPYGRDNWGGVRQRGGSNPAGKVVTAQLEADLRLPPAGLDTRDPLDHHGTEGEVSGDGIE